MTAVDAIGDKSDVNLAVQWLLDEGEEAPRKKSRSPVASTQPSAAPVAQQPAPGEDFLLFFHGRAPVGGATRGADQDDTLAVAGARRRW